MRVVLTNQEIHLQDAPDALVKRLRRILSYEPEGAVFSDAYREKRWDGRIHLLRWSKRTKSWQAPAGLAEDIFDELTDHRHELVDARRLPENPAKFRFRATPYPHQERVIAAALAPRGPLRTRARGIIRMAIRGGKTISSAGIMSGLGCRTLFLVEAAPLLSQAVEKLSDALGVKAGVVGGGVWQPGRELTVAMVQSLVAKRGGKRKVRGTDDEYEKIELDPRLTELLGGVDLIVFDECHHLEGATYRAIMAATDCPYKIGLTATLNEEPRDMHLHGATGPVLAEVGASELIEIGRLVAPEVRMVRYERTVPAGLKAISKHRTWSAKLRKMLIDENTERNELVARTVRALLDEGLRSVLVHVVHLEHADQLVETIQRVAKIKVTKVVGKTMPTAREKAIQGLDRGVVKCVVSNILTEGVDVPGLEACINAADGADRKQTMQRLRNITADPKRPDKRAVYVDVADVSHLVTAEHAALRLRVYRSEPGFQIRTWAPA